MSKDLTDVDDFTSPIHVPEGTDSRDDAAGDVELIAQRLANRTRNLKNRTDVIEGDYARKSQQNTFTKSQIVNTESNWADDPLITTTAKPGDDPTDLSGVPAAAGSNRWKLILAAPTQGTAYGGIFIGQSPDGAAMVNNARWHIPTQKWRQIDPAYPSTAIVGRSGQWGASHVPAGAVPWTDWPLDTGGDFIAGGNVACNGHYLYNPTKAVNDFTIPLACSSGEAFIQTDGSYKVGTLGAAWPVKVPDLTVLSNIYVLVDQATAAQSYAELYRRDKGNIAPGFAVLPTYTMIASANGAAASGVQSIQLTSTGHVALTASWEYAVMWKGGHADDKIHRIALGTFNDAGPRNLG